jgi:predicted DNA-binding protein with PD1-like motif
MKFATLTDNKFAVRLDPGDDVHQTIQQFCLDQSIKNAAVQGIGSVDSPTLGFYSMATKQFTDKVLTGIHEVTNLSGNISMVDGQPFAHLHATVCNDQMQAFGGHLIKAKCSATLELIVSAYPTEFTKSMNEEVGLKIWDF